MTDWRERRLGPRVRARLEKDERKAQRDGGGTPTIFVIRVAARTHAEKAVDALATLMERASSEHVRVAAANAILDRAIGKPLSGAQAAEEDEEDEGGAIEIQWLSGTP
jgi:hypothetical protein